MPVEVTELVDLARGSDASAREAAEQLGTLGVTALPAVLEAIANPWIDPGMLPMALTAIYATAPLDILAEGFGRGEYLAFQSAMRAAEMRHEDAVTDTVIEKLKDADELPGRRAAAAEFLGNRGHASALPALNGVYSEALRQNTAEDDPPRFAVETVVALAKLGDFRHGSYLVDLASHPYAPTRALAVSGLRVAVGPGMVGALRRAAQDSVCEVSVPALEALFLLRCPAAVDALLDVARDGDPTVSGDAIIRANDILGAESSDVEALSQWWSAARDDWDPDTCYRAGEPFTMHRLFDLLQSATGRRNEVLREVVLTTGSQPGDDHDFTPDELRGIAIRLDQAGRLYRWGHAVELAHVR